MKVSFYGTRGSISTPERNFSEFGGNTSCVLLSFESGRIAILDAGTGLRRLGNDFPARSIEQYDNIFIGLSHTHWDHIQGFPFFKPAYDARRHFTVAMYGKASRASNLASIFETQMQRDFFPVSLEGMGATIDFLTSGEDCVRDGDARVIAIKHNHPGDAYTYRIESVDGRAMVFCTDIEHGDDIDPRIVELARGADLLVHEGQFTPEELDAHRGWGHSSWEQAVEVAQRAGVKRLVVTHHDPDHDDAFLREIERKVKARMPHAVLAREGMSIQL